MGWLVERLTPYKRSHRRWYDLAVALEEYWDTYQTPAAERLEHLRSIFHAHDEDVEKLLTEAGIQFEVAIPLVRDNLAFAYAWRAYEIHRKDRNEALEQILRRDYSGVFIKWQPLYAPKGVPYGDVLLNEQDVEFSDYEWGDLHRTYRGALQVNLSGLRLQGVTAGEFSKSVRRKLDAIRPAHIVYEGEYFFQAFKADFEVWLRNSQITFSQLSGRLIFTLGHRYDDTPADAVEVDYSPVDSARFTWLEGLPSEWEDMPPWKPGGGSYIDGEYWPLFGQTGNTRQRAGLLGDDLQHHARLNNRPIIPSVSRHEARALAEPLAFMQRLFDVERADTLPLDDYEPLRSAQASRYKAVSARVWPERRPWRLDLGPITPDGTFPTVGVEGDSAQWFYGAGNYLHQASEPALFCLAGNKNTGKPTFKSAHWLQFVTNDKAQPSLAVTGTLSAAQDGTSYTLPATAVRPRPAPPMPRMDDVPADFAPLDMSYEVPA